MATAFLTGMETGTMDEWYFWDYAYARTGGPGEWSRWMLQFNNNQHSDAIARSRNTPTPINIVHFHAYMNGTDGGHILSFRNPAHTITHVKLGIYAGALHMYTGNDPGQGVVATGPNQIGGGTAWRCIEIYANIATSGTFKVWLDGALEINATGVDIRQDDTAGGDGVGFLWWTGAASCDSFDDIVWFDDNTSTNKASTMGRTGCLAVTGMYVTGDGSGVTQGLEPQGYATSFDTTATNTSPYAWYKLDETSGTTADNAEGTAARDGTYVGTPTLNIDGKPGAIRAADKAVRFDGSDDHVALPSGMLDLASSTSTWSCAFWVRSEHRPTGKYTYPIVTAFKTGANYPLVGIWLEVESNANWNSVVFVTRDNTGTWHRAENASYADTWMTGNSNDPPGVYPWNDGRWHFVACVRETDKTKNIYIDGVLATNPVDALDDPSTGMNEVYIGRGPVDADISDLESVLNNATLREYSPPDVEISEVLYWQDALTATEVNNMWAAGCWSWEQVNDGSQLTPGSTGYTPDVYDWQHMPDDDISYVASDVDNARDLYALEDLAGYFGDPLAVAVKAQVKKGGPGTRSATIVAKDGGTEYDSEEKSAPLSYLHVEEYYDTKPSGGAWTDTAANALEVGIKAT